MMRGVQMVNYSTPAAISTGRYAAAFGKAGMRNDLRGSGRVKRDLRIDPEARHNVANREGNKAQMRVCACFCGV